VTLEDVLKGYGVSGSEHLDEDEGDDEDYHASR
jgi:hypothetical protein